ncbi:hypothetical protein BFC22_08715 [Carnobacterium divergens]|uniref:DUF3784 domain-containing protein n=3 Tax=Carnobacterium divergens TaxID=2748 RepID=A0A0R2HNT4_CARDV|nr:hypothetical protein [Carnobacterium divergens]AOA00184.1 hypothetical protein BFC22_08715 [Carnobacterium divergens]KRN54563.1 hypothetical protein IV74_GL002147 [Carnobacterium divergens DSM 20623]MDO0874047.1 hypothetical protein [Carnobacterium divergens]MDT1957546.1 hypothetical protein [Carnobacterium divergens]MDT1973749.1 hypothetical protein [Carnobacterium divergens]
MTILMVIFALILFAIAFFLLSGKASVLIINEQKEQHQFNQKFFKSYGYLMLIFGLFACFLVFYHQQWLWLTFLAITSFLMVFFVIGLNRRIN